VPLILRTAEDEMEKLNEADPELNTMMFTSSDAEMLTPVYED
jgi:hypothetical protein